MTGKPINSEEISEDVSFEIGPYFIPPGYEVICTDPSHNMGRFFHLDHCSGIKLKRPINSVSPASTKEETAQEAWYRAFQYAARHGWEYELDGIPDYIAPEPESSIESD